ncbi:hypothetical protein ACFSYD_07635 [Paracoccus aerius]
MLQDQPDRKGSALFRQGPERGQERLARCPCLMGSHAGARPVQQEEE